MFLDTISDNFNLIDTLTNNNNTHAYTLFRFLR